MKKAKKKTLKTKSATTGVKMVKPGASSGPTTGKVSVGASTAGGYGPIAVSSGTSNKALPITAKMP